MRLVKVTETREFYVDAEEPSKVCDLSNALDNRRSEKIVNRVADDLGESTRSLILETTYSSVISVPAELYAELVNGGSLPGGAFKNVSPLIDHLDGNDRTFESWPKSARLIKYATVARPINS